MKRTFAYAAFAWMLIFAVCQSFHIQAIYAQQGEVLSVDDVIKGTNPATKTKTQIDSYWEQVKDKNARGEGIVVNVLPGRKLSPHEARVLILTPASKPAKGHNVVLYTNEQALSELKKHDKVSFEGKIGMKSSHKGGSIDVEGTYKKL